MPIAEQATQLALNRILVATDFGPAAETATNYAVALARHFASTLTVAHVVDLSVSAPSEAAMAGWPVEQMRHDSQGRMDRLMHRLNLLGVNVRSRELEGHNPAAAIVDLAELAQADLVVMGTNSRHGLSKLIGGSCAQGVIHHATCPVMTLGPKVKLPAEMDFNPRTVVFATDLHHQAVEKAGLALAFAKETLAKVYVCHVVKEDATDELGLIDLASQSEVALLRLVPPSIYDWCNMEYVVRSGKAGERIVELASNAGADLIVLGARRQGSYHTSHLTRSVVEHVLAEAECPVMTLCAD
jgi:nucleotide-binding universal stress UspA family protein